MLLFFGRVIKWLGKKELLNFIDDRLYLQLIYSFIMGKFLHLDNPVTLNEKIQWLKIYDKKLDYPKMVDKYTVKGFVSSIIGDKYIIPTLGIWDKFEDINFDKLPDKFVLKCTHDSGSYVICKDKSKFDLQAAKKKIVDRLSHNYFWRGREWAYKNIKPRIIAEQYMEDRKTNDLRDYKFYCFRDKVDCVLLCTERESGNTKFYFFDRNWELKRYNKQGKEAPKDFTLPKPVNIDKMFELAGILSEATKAPFVRVDLYNVNEKIYFGELTFYPDCGMDRNRLTETDFYFGQLVKLPNILNERAK